MAHGDDQDEKRREILNRLHMIRGPSEDMLGNRVVQEGMRQLSLPGQYVRGALAGKPGAQATGEEMLKNWGVTHPHPVGSFAWDVATDPLTYAGPGLMNAGGKAADLLRAGGRVLGEGPAASPLVNAMNRFGREEQGWLKYPVTGVPKAQANAMDVMGPQYPGGVAKLWEIAAQVGNPAYEMHSATHRLADLARSPFGSRLAGEIPEGSHYLGSGAEGLAIRTPAGGVIRVGDLGRQVNRPRIPETLQPFRVTQVGPYPVEHLPLVSPLNVLPPAGSAAAERLLGRLRGDLKGRGFLGSDFYDYNAAITPEGRVLTHDPGAIRMRQEIGRPIPRRVQDAFAPYPVGVEPNPRIATRALAAGGPARVQESLARGLAEGTRGQGVDLPGLQELLDRYPDLSRGTMARPVAPPSGPMIRSDSMQNLMDVLSPGLLEKL